MSADVIIAEVKLLLLLLESVQIEIIQIEISDNNGNRILIT